MTTTTHDTAHEHVPAAGREHRREEPREHRLRDVVPAAVSVVLLFGLLMAAAFALREVAGLGLWLVGS